MQWVDGGSDNLGNHIATKILDMDGHNIIMDEDGDTVLVNSRDATDGADDVVTLRIPNTQHAGFRLLDSLTGGYIIIRNGNNAGGGSFSPQILASAKGTFTVPSILLPLRSGSGEELPSNGI